MQSLHCWLQVVEGERMPLDLVHYSGVCIFSTWVQTVVSLMLGRYTI